MSSSNETLTGSDGVQHVILEGEYDRAVDAYFEAGHAPSDQEQTDFMIAFVTKERNQAQMDYPFKFTVWFKPENEDEPWLVVNEIDDSFSFWQSLDAALGAVRGEAASYLPTERSVDPFQKPQS